MDFWYYLLLRSRRVISWGWRHNFSRIKPMSTRADQMRYWRNWIGLQDKPSRQFSRGVPKQCTHRWQQRCQSCLREGLVVSYSTQAAYSVKWRRRTDICGEKSLAIANQFPWRINCFPEPNDAHLLKAYWTSAVMFCRWLREAGPAIVASARFWSFNHSGRSLIQFVANVASSRMLNFARSRKLLIRVLGRYGGARIETTSAFEIQSPRTERTCHSVGTIGSREIGTNLSVCKMSPRLWKILSTQEDPSAVILLLKVLYLIQPPNLPWLKSETEEMFTTENLIFCYGQEQTLRYCFHMTSLWLVYSLKTVEDITTILGFFILIFAHKLCSACGEKPSAFFVLRSAGVATMSPCRSSMALKQDLSVNSSQTSVWPSQESHNTGALVRSHEYGDSSRFSVFNGLCSVLALTWKMKIPALITTMGPLTARISTSNHFPDFRPCWILFGSSCQ